MLTNTEIKQLRNRFFAAVKEGNLQKAKECIEEAKSKGIDNITKFKDHHKKAPLHYAVENNNIEIAKLLIAHGANVDAQDYEGFTPLYYTAKSGNIEFVDLLLSNGANANFRGSVYNRSVLHSAVSGKKNVKEIIKLLLDKGANIDSKDFVGNTPLSSAVSYENFEAVEYLIDNGADTNITIKGRSLLDIAIDKGNSEIAIFLVDRGYNPDLREYGWTPLHSAAFLNQLNEIDSIIKSTSDINAVDEKGLTPLHLAARQAHPEMIRILLDNGANIESKDKSGNTPLQLAAKGSNHLEAAKLLLEEGADINTQNSHSDTPLHLATRYNREKIVELLLDSGANVNAQNREGKTPIYHAIKEKNPRIVKLLYNHGANIDSIEDKEGRTASSLAEYYER